MFRHLGVLVFSILASCAFAAEDVRLAHALEGVAKWELDQLAARFNKTQPDFRVVPAQSPWPEGELDRKSVV